MWLSLLEFELGSMEYVSLRYDGIMRGALSFAGSYYSFLSRAFSSALTPSG